MQSHRGTAIVEPIPDVVHGEPHEVDSHPALAQLAGEGSRHRPGIESRARIGDLDHQAGAVGTALYADLQRFIRLATSVKRSI